MMVRLDRQDGEQHPEQHQESAVNNPDPKRQTKCCDSRRFRRCWPGAMSPDFVPAARQPLRPVEAYDTEPDLPDQRETGEQDKLPSLMRNSKNSAAHAPHPVIRRQGGDGERHHHQEQITA